MAIWGQKKNWTVVFWEDVFFCQSGVLGFPISCIFSGGSRRTLEAPSSSTPQPPVVFGSFLPLLETTCGICGGLLVWGIFTRLLGCSRVFGFVFSSVFVFCDFLRYFQQIGLPDKTNSGHLQDSSTAVGQSSKSLVNSTIIPVKTCGVSTH